MWKELSVRRSPHGSIAVNLAVAAIILMLLMDPILSYASSTSPVSSGSIDASAATPPPTDQVYDLERIKSHIKYFSSLGSRITGYPGMFKAADYIAEKFKEYGLQPPPKLNNNTEGYFHKYKVVVPLDQGATINVEGYGTIKAYNMWPNFIVVAPFNGRVRLVYCGYGSRDEIRAAIRNLNVKPEEAFAVLEFNSGDSWMKLLKLGFKGVIFLQPETTTNIESKSKFILAPLKFPRLYVKGEEASVLRKLSQKAPWANITSEIRMDEVTGINVIGVVEGTKYKDRVIAVMTYYDDWSPVPAIAPGAEEAINPSVLLELARYYSEHKPEYTMWFIALSGHYQALAGSRELAWTLYKFSQTDDWKKLFGDKDKEKSKGFDVVIGIDIASDSNKFALHVASWMYEATRYLGHDEPYDVRYQPIVSVIKKQFGTGWFKKKYPGYLGFFVGDPNPESGVVINRQNWYMFTPTTYYLDTEIFNIAGLIAFTLRTTGGSSRRLNWGVPINTMDKINYENALTQAKAAFDIIDVVKYSFNRINWNHWGIQQFSDGYGMRHGGTNWGGGINMISGNIYTYNASTGSYSPLRGKNAFVRVVRYGVLQGRLYDPFAQIIVKADKNGHFEVKGLANYLTSNIDVESIYWVDAWVLDAKTGNIVYAPDYKRFATPFTIQMRNEVEDFPAVVFECSSIVLMDIIRPDNLKPLMILDEYYNDKDPVTGEPTYTVPVSFKVYDFKYHTELNSYGFFENPAAGIYAVFIPINKPVEIIYLFGDSISGVLVNASKTHPQGVGYEPKPHEMYMINLTPLEFARDLMYISKTRLDILIKFKLISPHIEQSLSKLKDEIANIDLMLSKGNVERVYSSSLIAWREALSLYKTAKKDFSDITLTFVILYMILLPFAFMLERLIIGAEGKKRIIGILGIFIAFFALISTSHPAFYLPVTVINVPIIITGLSILSVTILLCAVFFGFISEHLKAIRLSKLGAHYAMVNRFDQFLLSLSVGIANMRKRRIRTFLTLLSLTLVVYALVSLTSLTPTMGIQFSTRTVNYVPYNGLLVKAPENNFISPEQISVVQGIATKYYPNATVFPRVWLLPPTTGFQIGENIRPQVMAELSLLAFNSKGNYTPISGILGLSSKERLLANVLPLVWPRDDARVCIITKEIAQKLNVNIDNYIYISGYKLRVINIIDSKFLSAIKDLDGIDVRPQYKMIIDPQTGAYVWRSVDSKDMIIMPYKTLMKIGGTLRSVGVSIPDPNDAKKAARALAWSSLGIFVYVGLTPTKTIMSFLAPGPRVVAMGFEFLIIPLAIGALTILATSLSNIYERTKEIAVYSSVGLSPTNVVSIFFTETIVNAIVSSVLGYSAALAFASISSKLGLLPPEYLPNYSSGYVTITILITMLCTIAASIYPLRKAAKIVTPSLERKWKIPTKPREGEWFIPFPFIFTDTKELEASLLFLKEYFDQYVEMQPTATFHTREIDLTETTMKIDHTEMKTRILTGQVSIAPFSAGVTQRFTLKPTYEEDRWRIDLILKKTGGPVSTWKSANYKFIDEVRKQLIRWKGLRPSRKEKYYKMIGG